MIFFSDFFENNDYYTLILYLSFKLVLARNLSLLLTLYLIQKGDTFSECFYNMKLNYIHKSYIKR
jgi:hypothetical protein